MRRTLARVPHRRQRWPPSTSPPPGRPCRRLQQHAAQPRRSAGGVGAVALAGSAAAFAVDRRRAAEGRKRRPIALPSGGSVKNTVKSRQIGCTPVRCRDHRVERWFQVGEAVDSIISSWPGLPANQSRLRFRWLRGLSMAYGLWPSWRGRWSRGASSTTVYRFRHQKWGSATDGFDRVQGAAGRSTIPVRGQGTSRPLAAASLVARLAKCTRRGSRCRRKTPPFFGTDPKFGGTSRRDTWSPTVSSTGTSSF